MQPIALLLPELSIEEVRPKIRGQRDYVISLFAEKLNSQRGDRKPLTNYFIVFKMSHLDVQDLYHLYKMCDTASCGFSAAWWHQLDTEKEHIVKYKRYKKL